MSVSQMLGAVITGSSGIDNSDEKWRIFILDHLDYIAVRSPRKAIDALLMNKYRYDLQRFLKQYLQRQQDLAWIVLLLNNMKNDLEFDTPTDLIVPTDELITQLYHSYLTTTANAT